MENRTGGLAHHVILEGRSRMAIAGVEDVESFDEESVVCHTSKGLLLIKGSGLHIDKLNIEGGELSVEGLVSSIVYEDDVKSDGGFWSRVFR